MPEAEPIFPPATRTTGASRLLRACLLPLGIAALAVGAIVAQAADPDALWKIVHGRCVPGEQTGDPSPCIQVGADDAVLKDLIGATQFLLIPTARITGIESPAVLAPDAPNFFAAAWRARHFLDQRVGHAMPRDMVSLAINPPGARSQDQLHIHIDCIRPDVRDALRTVSIDERWTMLPIPLAGQRYAAMRLAGDTLDHNPFRVLAEEMPGARDAMGLYTLVVVGSGDAATEPGFILLAGRGGADGPVEGENLQDHRCALGALPG